MSEFSVPPPGYAPPAPVEHELMTGVKADPHLLAENRKPLDRRRLLAHLIDDLLLAIPTVPLVFYAGLDIGVMGFCWALMLAFNFVFEVATGRTPGKQVTALRVVMANGDPLTQRAASIRAVLRIVDSTLAGPIVYLASRGRRRRIGDYAAGTIVCDVKRVGHASRGARPGDLLWPMAWMAPAILVLSMSLSGEGSWTYRAGADRVCAQAQDLLANARAPNEYAYIRLAVAGRLSTLRPPPNWRDRHELLLRALRGYETADSVRAAGYRACAQLVL